MAKKDNSLYNFADWYLALFEGKLNSSHFREFESDSFAEKCRCFGFVMDCGKSMEKRFPGASYDERILESVIEEIKDIKLIGSAIFSRWRYYMHWAMSSYLDDEAREWFIIAFKRLQELSAVSVFEGTVDKIVIDTEAASFCAPKPGQEVRQRITIHEGSAAFTRYYFDESLTNYTKVMKRYKGMYNEKMMYYIAEYFKHFYDEIDITDAAKWRIELTNTEGKRWRFSGPVCDEIKVENLNLSALARAYLKISELWMFDFKVGDDVFIKHTIDEFTEYNNHSPMVYLAETEHFKIYEEKEKERGDTGVPIYVVENKLGNAFCFCGADVSYLIMKHCYGGNEANEIVEKAIIYDCLKEEIEKSYESEDYTFNERVLKGIDRPIPKSCELCIYSRGDAPENDGADKIQCQKYNKKYQFKPFEIMFDIEVCGYHKESSSI